MPTASTNLQRTLGQRPWLLALVVALVLAPLLANIWPAFGKGPMLFVAETAGQPSAHEAHEAPADQSHHQRHCALCVLAFLGWAPPADLSLGCAEARATECGTWIAADPLPCSSPGLVHRRARRHFPDRPAKKNEP